MSIAEIVLWTSCFLVVYVYLLYPALLFVAFALTQARRDLGYLLGRRERRRLELDREDLPAVSLVIPAHNEEGRIPAKLRNLEELDYPKDRLDAVFVSDGSTDRTAELLEACPEPWLQVVRLSLRGGKPAALNAGVVASRHDLLVFCDAATLLRPDAVRMLVRHFADPEVGVACGSLLFEASAESKQTEGAYWRIEAAIRLMEGRLGATLTASGALYALRKQAFAPLDASTVIDDFVIPMNARRKGFRVIYDPEARATEFAAETVSGEFRRRVRLAVGSYRALSDLWGAPLGLTARFAFVSHKLLRWTLPFVMVALFLSNLVLAGRPFYNLLLVSQALFYSAALLGWRLRARLVGVRFALLPYFLVSMNFAYLLGFFRFLAGKDEVRWQRLT